jgi:hypothetical protein
MGQNKLKESILNKDEFTVTWELVPGRGAREKNQEFISRDERRRTGYSCFSSLYLQG